MKDQLKKNNYLKFYEEHLAKSYMMGLVAKNVKSNELLEISSHYIFDLIDWGRKNFDINDFSKVTISNSHYSSSDEEITISDLEKEVETRL